MRLPGSCCNPSGGCWLGPGGLSCWRVLSAWPSSAGWSRPWWSPVGATSWSLNAAYRLRLATEQRKASALATQETAARAARGPPSSGSPREDQLATFLHFWRICRRLYEAPFTEVGLWSRLRRDARFEAACLPSYARVDAMSRELV